MKFYDDYWTKAECERVASWGKANRGWTITVCQESLLDWDLYYDI
jgi:hypothetical protein